MVYGMPFKKLIMLRETRAKRLAQEAQMKENILKAK